MESVIMEFFNLRQSGLDMAHAVALLASRHYLDGRKVLVLANDDEEAARLDEILWTFDPGSFIPHAVAGAGDEQGEPVLILTEHSSNPNRAKVLIMTRVTENPPIEDFEHVITFVPLDDGPQLETSRQLYKEMMGRPGLRLIHTTHM